MNPDDNAFLEGFTESSIPESTLGELQAVFGEFDIEFHDVLVRTHEHGVDVVGDASWTEFNEEGSHKVARRVIRTFMFFHRPNTTLPEFSIQAKRGLAGRFLLGITARLVGMPTFELEGEPAFNEKFNVVTMNSESVKVLLGREMIDGMVAIENLNLSFVSRGLLFTRHPGVYRSGRANDVRTDGHEQDERVGGDDRIRFIEDAMTVCAPVANDPDIGRRAADAVEGSYAEEAFRNVTEQGGLVGKALKKMTVTSEMLAHLEGHPVPRRDIPDPVQRRAWGGTNFPLVIVAVLGAAALSVAIVVLLNGGGGAEWVLLLVGLVAYTVFGFVLAHRMTRKRIITHGRVVPGRISAVEKTDTSINDDVVHAITVQPEEAGSEPIIAKMSSQPAKSARRMMERDEATWVLVDPKKPSRGIWPHGWTLEAMAD